MGSKKDDPLGSRLIYEHLNTIKYSSQRVNDALSAIISHPTIRQKIEWEAGKFAQRNPELTKEDLIAEAGTILYGSIMSEWKKSRDPNKAISWCCARVGWRVSTHVSKEIGLERKTDAEGKGVYLRPDRTELTEEITATLEAPSTEMNHSVIADLIRDANIEPKFKHPLVYVLILGSSFKDLARWYGCTAPTASNIYKKALNAFKEYVESSSPEESAAIFDAIKDIIDN